MLSLKRYNCCTTNPILERERFQEISKKSRFTNVILPSLDSTALFCYNQIHQNISMITRRSDGSMCFL